MGIILTTVIILLVAALPATWPYTSGWGYLSSGGLAAVLLVSIILLTLGYVK